MHLSITYVQLFALYMYLYWCKKMYEIYCKLRDEKGLSDYKVAQDLGFSRSTFSQWKAGSSQPKRDKLQKIADYFGVSTQYLLTGDSRYKYLPDINDFMNQQKYEEMMKQKEILTFTEKFSKLGYKDREEIMRIIDMKLEMANEG